MLRANLRVLRNALVAPGVGADASLIHAERYGSTRFWLGIDRQSQIHLLVKTVGGGPTPAATVLRNFEARYDVRCRIRSGAALTDQTLTVISCLSGENAVIDAFLAVSEALIELVGDSPTRADIGEAVTELARIFSQLYQPQSGTLTGLIGELVLLQATDDVDVAVTAWHVAPTDRHDFVFGSARVEVKATTSRVRRHTVAYEQLATAAPSPLYFASVLVEYVDTGVSVLEVLDRIEARLTTPRLRLKFRRLVASTLGAGFAEAIETRFDLDAAVQSLAVFFGGDIPGIRDPLPAGVSHVNFDSDFSSVSAISEFEQQGILS